jgi:hypothetical protein
MKSRKKNTAKRIRLTMIFFLVVCLATTISAIARKSGYSFPGLQNLMILMMLIVLGWFGWLSVRSCDSSLAQNILLGVMLSFGSNWSLPLFHKGREILQLMIANSAIFAFVAFLGGCFAVLFHKVIEAKKRNNDYKK